MSRYSVYIRAREALGISALAATLVCLWAFVNEYGGLAYDAQIYAVQALSKLRPSLAGDLFLQNLSQDKFTVFPWFYAWTIELFGLRPAALALTIIFTIWLQCSSWLLVRTLAGRDVAWLTIFLMVVVGGDYGAFGVFAISEPFLTARLPAEALVTTALAFHVRGYPRIAAGIVFAALFIHPIMALPGIFLLICLRLPPRVSAIAAGVLVFGTLVASTAAANVSYIGRIVPILDSSWAHVVRERSQFLFLQLWRAKDWALNARPLITLGFLALIFPTSPMRKLAIAAALVGFTGIAIAAIGSLIGPIAPLTQGQPWRWNWVAVLLSMLLMLPAARVAWQDRNFGPVCAILLIAGWLLPAEVGAACVSLAVLTWAARQKFPASWMKIAPVVGVAIAVAFALWGLIGSWTKVSAMYAAPAGDLHKLAFVRAVFAIKISAALIAGALWWFTKSSKGPLGQTTIVLVFGVIAWIVTSDSYGHLRPYGSPLNIQEFDEWRDRIPSESTVFVTNGHDSGSFVWFTLQRNNYLASSQSAGVVFSRATALEVQRRSDVLLPINDPNWKILTAMERRPGGAWDPSALRISNASSDPETGGRSGSGTFRALTPQVLVEVCRDTLLGFVISPDDVGFGPVTHTNAGPWHNWKLYDCNVVRTQMPST